MDIQKLDQTYIAGTYARFPVTIVKGKGSLVWDENGKEYIDLSTGIAVDIFGVADEQWMEAVTKQLGTLQHISNLYYTVPCAKLAQLLCENCGAAHCGRTECRDIKRRLRLLGISRTGLLHSEY